MPNTPLLVGQGAAAYCLGRSAKPEDEAAVRRLLGAGSTLVSVDEDKMDAVGPQRQAPGPLRVTARCQAGVSAGGWCRGGGIHGC